MKSIALLIFFTLFYGTAFSQLNVIVKGGDFKVCIGDSIAIEAEIVSGSPTAFSWMSSVGMFANDDSFHTKALFSGSGTLVLRSEDGTNTFYDTVSVTVNALPNIQLKRSIFCQNLNEYQLKKEVVQSPANFLGTPSWKCLDCNGNNFDSMLVDKLNVGGLTDYWLDVSESAYTIVNQHKDTIVLEFSYISEKGCTNQDTVEIEIWRVPKIIFSSLRDLCWDEGEISLNSLTGVNLTDGYWSVVDTPNGGYEPAADLGGISTDTINTTRSVKSTSNDKKWLIRYTHVATGCSVSNDTVLTINASPALTLTPFNRQPANYCEDEMDMALSATPANGFWSSTDPSSIKGDSAFSPQNVMYRDSAIWFYYSYTSPVNGCGNRDSLEAYVQSAPTLQMPTDALNKRSSNIVQLSDSFDIVADHYAKLYWLAVGANSNQVYLDPISNDEGVATFSNLTNLRDTFKLVVEAVGMGSCQSITGILDVIIYADTTSASNPTLLIAEGAELFPNPASGAFKLGNLDPEQYDVHIFDKWGKYFGVLEADVHGTYTLQEKGFFVVSVEHKQSKQRFMLRLLSL